LTSLASSITFLNGGERKKNNLKFDLLWQTCKIYLAKGRDIDLIHTRISTDFAWRLLKEGIKGNEDIVIPAIMFHDIGYSQIDDKDIYKKTTFPDKANTLYDIHVKELHLTEGERLTEKILKELNYPEHLIKPIKEIVRTHEDLQGNKPDQSNINRSIVSDADKLYRYTAHNITSAMSLHGTDKKDVFEFIYENIDKWLCLDISKRIAIEELRKLPFGFYPINEKLF